MSNTLRSLAFAGLASLSLAGVVLTPSRADVIPEPIDPPGGSGIGPECPPLAPRTGAVVDVRDFGALGDGFADDGPELRAAAAAAEGKVLYIPKGYVFLIQTFANGWGVPLSSGTTVTGGGTLKLGIGLPNSADRLLQIQNACNVTITGITLDVNVQGGAYSEQRHAIGIQGNTRNVTITDCTFVNLSGDGVYIGSSSCATDDCPAKVRVQGSRFFAPGADKNRTGVGLICGESIQIKDNLFYGMGRPGSPLNANAEMPGPVDLESDGPQHFIRNVEIAGNEMIGTTPCQHQVAIAVSNHASADYRNILIENNTIRGCYQMGILVNGSGSRVDGEGPTASPVVISGNLIERIQGSENATWDVGIHVRPNRTSTEPQPGGDNCAPTFVERGVSALVTGNVIRGISKGPGIWAIQADVTIEGNYVEGAKTWGIAVEDRTGARHAVINDNRIADCGDNGYTGEEYCLHSGDQGDPDQDGTLQSLYENALGAISLWGDNNVVTGNEITSSRSPLTPLGIYIVSGIRNIVSDNLMKGVGYSGINATWSGPQLYGINHIVLTSAQNQAGCADFPRLFISPGESAYPPTAETGQWRRGSIVYNPQPDQGEPIGWVCTGSGSPCTWQGFGTIGTPALDPTITHDDEWNTATKINNVIGQNGDTFVTRIGGQILENKNLSSPSNVFPASLATLTGTQPLTNKDLTSATNTFPAGLSQTLVFSTGTSTVSGLNYLGPNTGAKAVTESPVAVPMPAYTARELRCKVSVTPTAGKAWTLTARAGGSGLLSCTILAGQLTCSATGAVPWRPMPKSRFW